MRQAKAVILGIVVGVLALALAAAAVRWDTMRGITYRQIAHMEATEQGADPVGFVKWLLRGCR